MRTLILIDFRDFVADAVGCVLRLRQPPETVPETATLTLKHLLARWKISDIAFARTDTESWRQKQFPTYSYMRTDYVQQHWDVIQDWLTTHGFSVYFHPESEARDIIASDTNAGTGAFHTRLPMGAFSVWARQDSCTLTTQNQARSSGRPLRNHRSKHSGTNTCNRKGSVGRRARSRRWS